MYYQQQQIAIEIRTGVDSGVGESMVTTTTTPTVTPSPSANGTPSLSANSSVSNRKSEGRHESMETLDSYRQMSALVDSVIESESESKNKEDAGNVIGSESATVTRSGRVTRPLRWHSSYEANYAAMWATNAE